MKEGEYKKMKRFPNLPDSGNKKYIIVILAAILAAAVGLALYFASSQEKAPVEEEEEKEEIKEEMEEGPLGKIGEGQTLEEVNPEAVKHPVRAPGTEMPSVIFNTSGEVVQVKEDRILVLGSGSNFEDQKKRTLTVLANKETVITVSSGKYKGKEGLKYLSSGDRVLIESEQNIRGKTDFIAKYISKAK
jgi:hypothetical protein